MRTLHLRRKLPWRNFAIDAAISTVYWIVVLTPFMLLSQPSWLPVPLFVGMGFDQYKSWLVIELVLAPVLGAVSVLVVKKFERTFRSRK